MDEEAKNLEKERLIQEIKNMTKMANKYRTNAVKLMSYLAEIDPIYEEIRNKVNVSQKQLYNVKKDNLSEKARTTFTDNADNALLNFLEKGS